MSGCRTIPSSMFRFYFSYSLYFGYFFLTFGLHVVGLRWRLLAASNVSMDRGWQQVTAATAARQRLPTYAVNFVIASSAVERKKKMYSMSKAHKAKKTRRLHGQGRTQHMPRQMDSAIAYANVHALKNPCVSFPVRGAACDRL